MRLVQYIAAILVVGWASLGHAQEFTMEHYRALEEAMDEADVLRAATSPDTSEREAATQEAIDSRRELIQFLTDWIASGELTEQWSDYARGGRSVLIENLIQIYSEVGDCEEGSRLLVAIVDWRDSEVSDERSAYLSAEQSIEECEATAAASESPELTERGGRRAGIALLSVGAALAAGGATWNFLLLDDRNEIERLRESCDSVGSECDEQGQALSQSLSGGRRAAIGVLVAGGLITAALGVRQLVRSDDLVPVTLAASRDGASATVNFRW